MGPGGPRKEESDVCESDVTMHRTGSHEPVNSVVSTIVTGGPDDETGSVADAPRDAIVMLSECRDSDPRDIGQYTYVTGQPPVGVKSGVVNHPTVLYLTRGCLPLICALRG